MLRISGNRRARRCSFGDRKTRRGIGGSVTDWAELLPGKESAIDDCVYRGYGCYVVKDGSVW